MCASQLYHIIIELRPQSHPMVMHAAQLMLYDFLLIFQYLKKQTGASSKEIDEDDDAIEALKEMAKSVRHTINCAGSLYMMSHFIDI